MSTTGGSSSGATGPEQARGGSAGRISFLDQALWKQFGEAATTEAFVRAWLGLQCRFIDGVTSGVVVLGESDEGPFAPAAYWPDEGAANEDLSAVAEVALAERRGVVQGQEEEDAGASGPQICYAAYPFLVDDRLYGVVAIELNATSRRHLRNVMRQLQWGVGWIEVMLRREQIRSDEARLDRIGVAFDLVAAALEQRRFEAACNATVTELTLRLNSDQVSIGFVHGRRTVVAAVSHRAQFGRRMDLIRDVGAAMDEAIDQGAVVLYPPHEGWGYRVARAHGELARVHGAGSVLTVPLHVDGRFFGALTFERPPGVPFDEEAIELCDCIAGVVGPILEEKRHNDRLLIRKAAESFWVQLKRLFGPRYFGRKLATAVAIAIVAFFAVAKDEYRVTAPATLEGTVQRSIVAPFDGYVRSEHARAGEIVRQGDLLATLDDRDLRLERLRWLKTRNARVTVYYRALAERERAETQIIQAQIEGAEAEIALLDAQIERTRLSAPFDGLVISGDLSQTVGGAVRRGDELFKIAPLDSYRVVLEVDEQQISDIEKDQKGTLYLSSMPLDPLSYTIERITPIAEAEEGRNFFLVEARLGEVDQRLRPGMGGVGKTSIEDRLLIRIWTDNLIDWVRLQLWKWLP